jgi:hypothetical protein
MKALNALRIHSGCQLRHHFPLALTSATLSLLFLAGCATAPVDRHSAGAGSPAQTKVVEAFTWRPANLGGQSGYAAELLRNYIAGHAELKGSELAISHLRAAVLFAIANETSQAIAELDLAQVKSDEAGLPADWNDMLVSAKAFLLKDHEQLVAARDRIAALPSPTYLHYPDSLLQHFGESYASLPIR